MLGKNVGQRPSCLSDRQVLISAEGGGAEEVLTVMNGISPSLLQRAAFGIKNKARTRC